MEGSSLAINITKFQSLRVLADSATELRMSLPINIFLSQILSTLAVAVPS